MRWRTRTTDRLLLKGRRQISRRAGCSVNFGDINFGDIILYSRLAVGGLLCAACMQMRQRLISIVSPKHCVPETLSLAGGAVDERQTASSGTFRPDRFWAVGRR